MENRLTPLMGDKARGGSARASCWGWRRSRPARPTEARTILTPLFVDQSAPQSITERAQIVMAEIAAGEIAKKTAGARRRNAACFAAYDCNAAGRRHAAADDAAG